MDLQIQLLADGVKHLVLSGRMDLAGTQAIDHRFAAATATTGVPVVVDLAQVSFLASIGIRTLLQNAKAVKQRGGRMVLLSPTADVESVLQSTGIADIIPIFRDLDTARAAARTA
jgi:anti-sigma B factor antagonist